MKHIENSGDMPDCRSTRVSLSLRRSTLFGAETTTPASGIYGCGIYRRNTERKHYRIESGRNTGRKPTSRTSDCCPRGYYRLPALCRELGAHRYYPGVPGIGQKYIDRYFRTACTRSGVENLPYWPLIPVATLQREHTRRQDRMERLSQSEKTHLYGLRLRPVLWAVWPVKREKPSSCAKQRDLTRFLSRP